MESERAAARLRPPVHGWPLSASFWRAACVGPRSSGQGPARFDQAHCTLPHLGRMLERPAHDSILLKNWSLHHKPEAVHEASPNTSAATASTRNADGKPNEE